jgi:hypothetical protein
MAVCIYAYIASYSHKRKGLRSNSAWQVSNGSEGQTWEGHGFSRATKRLHYPGFSAGGVFHRLMPIFVAEDETLGLSRVVPLESTSQLACESFAECRTQLFLP